MKKEKTIIGWMTGLIGLMACSQEGPDLQQAQRAVGFGSYTEQFVTRSEVKGAIPDGGSIGVYAYLHDGDANATGAWSAGAAPNFMWNQQATYHEDLDAFVYSPLKYWPNEEYDKLSFIAYYPYTNTDITDDPLNPVFAESTATTGLTPLLANSGTGLPTFNFTVKSDIAKQVDLLVSDLIPNLPQSRDTENDPGTPFNDLNIYDKVKFIFHHALAKVEFRIVADAEIRKDIEHFHLTDLNITDVVNKGTLTPTYDALTGTSLGWTTSTEPSDKSDYNFITYEPQLLLPQDLANAVMLNIDYEITFKSDGTSYHYEGGEWKSDQSYTYSKEASVQLNTLCIAGTTTPLTAWEAGHHYIYTIRLRANRIEFTGQVVDWGETVPINDIPIGE